VELQLVLEKAGSFFDQARIDAASESFDRSFSTEAMDAPLLEAALPVRGVGGRWVRGARGRPQSAAMGLRCHPPGTAAAGCWACAE
jgi:hypothetical protein